METTQNFYSDSKSFVPRYKGTVCITTDPVLCNHLEAMQQFSIHKVSLIFPRAAVMEYECNLLNAAHSGILKYEAISMQNHFINYCKLLSDFHLACEKILSNNKLCGSTINIQHLKILPSPYSLYS